MNYKSSISNVDYAISILSPASSFKFNIQPVANISNRIHSMKMNVCVGESPQVFSVSIWSSFMPQTKLQIRLASRGASPIQHCIGRPPHHRSKAQGQPLHNTLPPHYSRNRDTVTSALQPTRLIQSPLRHQPRMLRSHS